MVRKEIKLSTINRDEVARYLGYCGVNSDENIDNLLDKCEKNLLESISCRYVYKCFEFSTFEGEGLLKDCTLKLTGKDILSHLEGCEKAVLMCATVSENVERIMRKAQLTNPLEALLINSIANVAIEQLCDKVCDLIAEEYAEFYSTWRFSPGYGDFPLAIQREFLTVIDAQKKAGVYLTDGGMLAPMKSVTAVVGLSRELISRAKMGCATCKMNENCNFRKKGEHCGF